MYPGTRVKVFDPLLFIDDIKTPLSVTMKPATVICWRGQLEQNYRGGLVLGPYEDLIDVQFDHWPEGRISHGHFTNNVRRLERGE